MDSISIQKHVYDVGFKRHRNKMPGAEYKTDYISEGIFYAAQDPEFVKQTSDATQRFYKGDWGTMLDFGEVNIPGSEFGEYPSKFGCIYIHREAGYTVMFFMFER